MGLSAPYPPTMTRASRTWRENLDFIDVLMREVSRQTEPQEMMRIYSEGVDQLQPIKHWIATSRRNLAAPKYRITRSSRWEHDINPWEQKHLLPVFDSGIIGEWIYANRPFVIQDLKVDPSDPAAEHFAGMKAAFVMPQYDAGEALNMFIMLWADPAELDVGTLPDVHWRGNLFGRATHNLVLRHELSRALDSLDRELKVVGEMQRNLLPEELPPIPGLSLAAHYQTSQRAGGDYYDLFPLAGGRWGLFIADVSGHGTPAAVVMAITHALAHAHPGEPSPPSAVLGYLNAKLCATYTARTSSFVTAFYAVYDPATRVLEYSAAGHPPPRVARDSGCIPLDGVRGLPLGIDPDENYESARFTLNLDDVLMLYTDGITEAMNPERQLFGFGRLDDAVCSCTKDAGSAIADLLAAVETFTDGRPADDDRTLLAAKVLG